MVSLDSVMSDNFDLLAILEVFESCWVVADDSDDASDSSLLLDLGLIGDGLELASSVCSVELSVWFIGTSSLGMNTILHHWMSGGTT